MTRPLWIILPVLALLLAVGGLVCAQGPQVTIATPFQSTGERFFEQFGTGWSVRGPNFFATFGGGNVAVPPFGGFQPNAGLSGGWRTRRGPWATDFHFHAVQGDSRQHVSTTPMLTVTNGVPGSFFAGRVSPFVTGYVPIVSPYYPYPASVPDWPVPAAGVGHFNPVNPLIPAARRGGVGLAGDIDLDDRRADHQPSPMRGASPAANSADADFARIVSRIESYRRESSASSAALPPEPEMKRISATEYFERGKRAEREGKPGVARIYYQMAAKRTVDEALLGEIASRLEALDGR